MTRFTKLSKKQHLPATPFNAQPIPISSNPASIKRRLRRQALKERAMICFLCRRSGHSVKSCPKSSDQEELICYRCGSKEHTLGKCPLPNNPKHPLPYAFCFYCSQKGHLSGQCPENDRGLYPHGGGCKYCGSVRHLAKDCRPTNQEVGVTALGTMDLQQGADDDDVFVALYRMSKDEMLPKESKKAVRPASVKKIVQF